MKTFLVIIAWMSHAPLDRLEYEMPSLEACERMIVKLGEEWDDANENDGYNYMANCIQRRDEDELEG